MEKRWRILIIDDDHSFRFSMACVLEHWASVRVAEDIESARNLLTSWQPHAVILDPVLRAGDSIDLLYRIAGEGQRIIFCSLSRRADFPPAYRSDTVVYVPREWSASVLGLFIQRRIREAFTEAGNASQPPVAWGNGRSSDGSSDAVRFIGNGKLLGSARRTVNAS
ncbi:hypothetical protein NET03_07515 [Thermomicrobium sp. CFH 73360]|uniref:response regulator n=1 Tax=Thermomicrobium sp. CFH 73360 TaxID=2951987 RepID=UPI0020776645|nr:hypothetical protein [Thermomicrobium sp. CFH 73360]MCM8746379.1 hypothetical protein [Thermomicrobium sp. CFH 73360]